ncbi:class I SAM-dependent DNA methyltransferase [Metabacillus malikii]|uniref:Ubiquinone/menaquinone biosynthesis C-methylase UbiE n=1 Tax=Metabacillus malikii TaxID=1504265 RepID=A0ABT9ZGZ7_9BACI|nr:class I SAM-dependent methyltransferase [Metabacillus malikii]MDQ0231568.1 ubiquinone/menaquinone biosynthesis C-methylase UbiE [Metabacillus malikii]
MIYQGFAYIYDHLMEDAPYDDWITLIEKAIIAYHPDVRKILDVGCGTGAITLRLAEKQFDVTGVDISEDMLTVAQSKLADNHVQSTFLLQDMRELTGFDNAFDLVTICCDSLNYLENEADIQSTFSRVYTQLAAGGLFIFDVHSVYKITDIFPNEFFAEQDEDISYIWKSYCGEHQNSIEHDMTFFVNQDDYYVRYDELHYQRTYSVEQYSAWLEAASFEILRICGDFDFNQTPTSTTERVFFVARKK